ncbi:MAG: hypothetical protein E7170_01875 [Firmicutes bacterium]|nr:hypothetical protein [Bacillota bacterium]
MFETVTLKRILKKYESIFSDILFGFEFESIENNKIIFKNFSENKMIANINNNVINFYYKTLNIERLIELKLPNKDEGDDIKINEIVREIRPNGTIIEKIERIYGFSEFSTESRTLVDLLSKRYVFDKNIEISDIDEYNQCVDNLSIMKTIFECHMHVLVKPTNSVKWYKNSPYSTHTLLNGTDISHIYDVVNGIDKIARVYDLYNGVINERNANDIFSIHLGLLRKDCLGYRELIGITDKEDSICGKAEKKYMNQNPEFVHQLIQNRIGYNKAFSCDNLNSLIEAITHQKTSTEMAREYIENKLGILYDEFDLLDFDEQQRLIREYHKKNSSKQSKYIPVILGSGEHSIIVNVKKGEKIMMSDGTIVEVGLTPEDEKQRLEGKLNYSNPVGFVKKLTKIIKNINK